MIGLRWQSFVSPRRRSTHDRKIIKQPSETLTWGVPVCFAVITAERMITHLSKIAKKLNSYWHIEYIGEKSTDSELFDEMIFETR